MRRIMQKRCMYLLGFLLYLFSSLGSSANAASLESSEYDMYFKKYTGIYMPVVDWRVLKAQCFAESSFRVSVISPAGAKGICQFMDGTWADIERKIGLVGSPFDAKLNIQFASFYMGKQRNRWIYNRPEYDRHSLAMASYNAGFGNILKAQKKCNNSVFYNKIIACLPQVTGHNADETISYVEKIWKFYTQLIFF